MCLCSYHAIIKSYKLFFISTLYGVVSITYLYYKDKQRYGDLFIFFFNSVNYFVLTYYNCF